MNYLKYSSYVYIVFAAVLIVMGVLDLQRGDSPFMAFFLAAISIFMFFFRRRFQKRIEERRKDN